jgi:hypothetical protein
MTKPRKFCQLAINVVLALLVSLVLLSIGLIIWNALGGDWALAGFGVFFSLFLCAAYVVLDRIEARLRGQQGDQPSLPEQTREPSLPEQRREPGIPATPMTATVSIFDGLDPDAQQRKLTIANALLDRAADHLEQLNDGDGLNEKQQTLALSAYELVLIAREELDPKPPVP